MFLFALCFRAFRVFRGPPIAIAADAKRYLAPKSDGTIEFKPIERFQTIQLPLRNSAVSEPDATVEVALTDPTGAVVSGRGRATLTIYDDDRAGAVDVCLRPQWTQSREGWGAQIASHGIAVQPDGSPDPGFNGFRSLFSS